MAGGSERGNRAIGPRGLRVERGARGRSRASDGERHWAALGGYRGAGPGRRGSSGQRPADCPIVAIDAALPGAVPKLGARLSGSSPSGLLPDPDPGPSLLGRPLPRQPPAATA